MRAIVVDRAAVQLRDTEALDRGAIHDDDDDNLALSNGEQRDANLRL